MLAVDNAQHTEHIRKQGVFTYLLEGLGAQSVQFEELFALEADYLKQLR